MSGITNIALAQGPANEPFFGFVRFLLEFDGNDGDITTTDSSSYEHTVSRVFGVNATTAEISNAASISGGTSTNLLSSSSTNGAGWELPSGQPTLTVTDAADWTVELWFQPIGPTSALAPVQYLLHNSTGGNGISIYYQGNPTINRRMYARVNNTLIFTPLLNPVWEAGTWTHVALVRDGTTCYLYTDGIMNATTYNIGASALFFPDAWQIGSRGGTNDHIQDGGAYVDMIRWTHGVCRYPGGITFEPPTSY